MIYLAFIYRADYSLVDVECFTSRKIAVGFAQRMTEDGYFVRVRADIKLHGRSSYVHGSYIL